MNFAYARVSTADQNPDHQIDALLRAGVDRTNIHLDTASGAKASRPKLDLVLQLLREGDTLKVTRLDRLSRSVLHLVTLGADLRARKIGLHVTEQGIDTDTVEGRAMFGMLSALAELQRELIVANTMDGLASARASLAPPGFGGQSVLSSPRIQGVGGQDRVAAGDQPLAGEVPGGDVGCRGRCGRGTRSTCRSPQRAGGP